MTLSPRTARSDETRLEGLREDKPLLLNSEDQSNTVERENGEIMNNELKKEGVYKWRNYVGFWLLGLCTNYPYIVMLSAAYDKLSRLSNEDEQDKKHYSSCTLFFDNVTNASYYTPRECLSHGTYQVLLADILPTFFIKLSFPFFMHHIPYWMRTIVSVVFAIASFLVVALGTKIAVVLVGVACASASAGLAEITFLALTARYHKFTVAGWSSGTGASALAGALGYTGFSVFLSPRNSLLAQLGIPILMLLSYFFVLTKYKEIEYKDATQDSHNSNEIERMQLEDSSNKHEDKAKLDLFCKLKLNLHERVKDIWSLVIKYMIWLYLVYAAEYTINQSLFESLYYPNTHIMGYCLDQGVQYKWYQVMYQTGVFISRSSLTLFRIKYFHIMSLLQVLNFFLLFSEVIYQIVPSFWIIFLFILYEGSLGGAVYANVFHAVTKNTDEHREFAMGFVSLADATGIVTAGLASHFVHEYICSLGY